MTNQATTFAIRSMAIVITQVRGVVGASIEEMEEFLEFRKTFKAAWDHAVKHFPHLEQLSIAGFHFNEKAGTYGFHLSNGEDFNLVFRFRRIGVAEIAAYTVRELNGNTVATFMNHPEQGWLEIF